MQTFRTLVLCAAAAVIGAVLSSPRPAVSGEPERPQAGVSTRIAFVDVGRVFADSERAKTISAWVDDRIQRLKEEVESGEKEIEKLEAGFDTLKPGSKEAIELAERVERARWELASYQSFVRRRVALTELRTKALLWKQVELAAQKVAEESGFSAVLKFEGAEIDPGRMERPEQLDALALTRPVLYRDPTLDITREVIAIVDRQDRDG